MKAREAILPQVQDHRRTSGDASVRRKAQAKSQTSGLTSGFCAWYLILKTHMCDKLGVEVSGSGTAMGELLDTV